MSKVVTFSVVLVLVVGSGRLAAQNQTQNAGVGLINALDLLHGHQVGSSQQNLCLDTAQDVNGGLITQRLLGNFVEVGHASGDCAAIGIMQELQATGSQTQSVGYCVDPKMQAQVLGLMAGQDLSRSGGPGQGNANHVVVLQEDQQAANSGGISAGSANIVGLQDSILDGTAGSASVVTALMGVDTIQSQSSM